jgi:hypothetical protein
MVQAHPFLAHYFDARLIEIAASPEFDAASADAPGACGTSD